MSQLIINRSIKVEGVLTDATSVALSDATATYGVKRTDTGAIVVAAGTAMTKIETGVYRYTIDDAIAGVTYTWFIRTILNGRTYYKEGSRTIPADAGDTTRQLSRWTNVTTPAGLLSLSLVKAHCRVDADVEDEQIGLYLAAATDYAEDAMYCSLMPRSIQAVFYAGEPIDLPRGPVTAIEAIEDADGNNITDWTSINIGWTVRLTLNGAVTYPVTVQYSAGYASASAVPAKIRTAVLQHVATMYRNRESVSDKTMTPVPHQLQDFYRLNRRATGIA
jgi:uncharacterized phiE125 gp8 family phage protein